MGDRETDRHTQSVHRTQQQGVSGSINLSETRTGMEGKEETLKTNHNNVDYVLVVMYIKG